MDLSQFCESCLSRKFAGIAEGDLWQYGNVQRLQQYIGSNSACHLCALLGSSYNLKEATQERGDCILEWNIMLLLYKEELLMLVVHPGSPSQLIERRHKSRGRLPLFRDMYFYKLVWELESNAQCYKESFKVVYVNGKDPLKALPMPMFSHSGNTDCFKLMKRWISDCVQNHQQICPSDSAAILPRRILDVTVSEDNVRLVETTDKDAPLRGQYVALSYRWGKPRSETKPFLVTVPSVLERHKDSILIENCPQTIQDAIQTTRGLGLRFLWVDSLCILQGKDDPVAREDFSRQCVLMGDIYREAFVTLIAANTSCADDGFLKSRYELESKWVRLDSSVYIKLPEYHGPGAKVICDWEFPRVIETWRTTVDERAWCLQEKMLSRRILSFHDEGVLLACQTGNYTEVKGFSPWIADRLLKRPAPVASWKTQFWTGSSLLFHDKVLSTGNISKMEYENSLWTDIVSEYSRRSIEDDSDRIPAIAGVAKIWQQIFQDEYCVGMWRRHIHEQLLWSHWGRLDGGERLLLLSDSARVPSWSWLNVQGEVDFHVGLGGESSSLSDNSSDVSLKGKSFVTVECVVVDSGLGSLSDDIMAYLMVKGQLKELTDLSSQPILQPSLPARPRGLSFNPPEWRGIHFDTSHQNQLGNLHYLKIVSYKWRDSPFESYQNLSSGLIVQRDETNTSDESNCSEMDATRRIDDEKSKLFAAKPGHKSLPRYKRVGVLWGLSDRDVNYRNKVELTEIVIL